MPNLIENTSAYLEPIEYNNRTTAEKAYIDALIDSGSEWIEKYCNRIFLETIYTEEVQDGQGWNTIFPSNSPIISLTSIIIISSDGTETTYASTNFDVNFNTGEIRIKSSTTAGIVIFPTGFRNIKINYTGGFTVVPFTIQKLTADYVIQMFDPTLSVEGIEKERLGDYFYAKSKNYFEGLPFVNKKMLNQYRIRKV